jgi:hypothetical protein
MQNTNIHNFHEFLHTFVSIEPMLTTTTNTVQDIQLYAANGQLSKIQDAIDYIHDNFQNEELSSNTIDSIFNAYTKTQQNLLDSHDLNDAWQITTDIDDLLQEYSYGINDRRQNNHLSVQHFDSVIQAWDRLMIAYDKAGIPKKGMPQRANYHLEVMERLVSMHAKIHLAPSIDTYNTVLSMWSRSREHGLTSMTESIMRRIVQNVNVEPNPETYRIMIRSWSRVANDVELSKRKIGNAAFNATGYLMMMQGMMEKEHEEFEPTLDDYHVVFGAWGKGR